MQSLLMEAFNTQTKPTIKTDDLFTIQTNRFSIKPNNLGFEMKLMRIMTMVNKPKSSNSKKPSSRRSGKSKKPSTKKLTSRTANWGRIPPAEDSSQVSVAQGCGGAIYCRSSEKSKPFAQRDLIVHDGIAPPRRILFPPEKIRMDWQETQSVGVGLYNLGNMFS